MIPGHKKLRDEYSDTDDQPVIWVNWYEARLFCRWRGSGFHLPTEQEWERAASWDPARGVYRKYPWGDEFDPGRCNTREAGPGKTTPVGAYPDGVSAYGCYDMAGNVWEWTEILRSEKKEDCMLPGGSWNLDGDVAACSVHLIAQPLYINVSVGFRCART
jgi:formylglycine-generating enzyme required for sulfatase activity